MSRKFGKVRSEGTRPEMRVRRIVEELGLVYRTNVKELPGTPDIVVDGLKLIVMVHGCFWHVHGGRCKRGLRIPNPKEAGRRGFWHEKLARNVLRDQRAKSSLEKCGWRVIEVWECESAQVSRRRLCKGWRDTCQDSRAKSESSSYADHTEAVPRKEANIIWRAQERPGEPGGSRE